MTNGSEINVDSTKGLSLSSLSSRIAGTDGDALRVSVCNCALPSLDSLVDAHKRHLSAADNRITAIDLIPKNLPALVSLDLANNRIASLNSLGPLKALENLKHLNLEMNKVVSATSGYRDKVFELLPNLVSLDGVDRDGNDVELDEEEDDDDDGDDEDEYEDEDEHADDDNNEEAEEKEGNVDGDGDLEGDEEDEVEGEDDDEDELVEEDSNLKKRALDDDQDEEPVSRKK
ncbi:hypothetical protein BC830DRAFT_1173146 [Chytriomyces sp. MP71]|nr:hypothetical protein BC830DRAFT_1173146 [Chytriomyces sp. MP71]